MRVVVFIVISFLILSAQAASADAQQRGVDHWLLQEQATLHATGVGPNMLFGHSISVSGDTALIGAPSCLNQCQPAVPGRAFIVERDPVSGTWGTPVMLAASQGVPDDEFGYSVMLDGDTALVGAMRANIDGNNQQGAVYVFERDAASGDWVEQPRLTAADGAALDRFGYSLARVGDTLLVGANGATVDGTFSQGAVYVFERDASSGEWVEQTRLTASDGEAQNAFGSNVVFDGQYALIATPTASVAGNNSHGKAYVFERDEGTGDWTEVSVLLPAESASQIRFGASLALADGYALVGAPGTPIDGDSERGAVHVFAADAGDWQEVQRLEAPDGSRFHRFGSSLTVVGDQAVIGADGVYANGQARQGAIYRWQRDAAGGEWAFLDRVVAADLSAGDRFGASVFQAEGRVLVGAPRTEVNHLEAQGAVYVFEPPQPGLFVTPAAISFDPVPVDGSAIPATVTLYNTGEDPVNIDQLDDPGDPFPVLVDHCGPAPFVLAAGDQCDLELGFDPVQAGLAGASLELHSDAPGSPHAVALDGSGASHGLQFKLVAADGAQNDQFSVVALEGDLAVVGAPNAHSHGAAYVFERDSLDGVWQERAQLVPEGGAFNDKFGVSVALSAGTVLVGADGTDVDGNNHGAVYVFERDTAGAWQQQAMLLPDELGEAGFGGVRFGTSLATDDDLLLIGASGEDAAYLFERDASGEWSQQHRLTATEVTSSFGVSVALDGDALVVGASATNVDGNPLQGSAHVFERDAASGEWVEQPRLVAAEGQNLDRFGMAVALSGDRILVGSPPVLNADRHGRVHVFERDTDNGEWSEQTRLSAAGGSLNDLFGSSVLLSGDTAVIGAPAQHAGGHFESGAAYLFEYSADDGQWHQQLGFEAFDARHSDNFGTRMAMSDDTIMIGAIARVDGNNNRGAVYVFSTPDSASGLYFAPEPLVFSAVAAGETDGPRSVTVINSDGEPVTVTEMTAPSGPFAMADGNCGSVPFTLAPGAGCTLAYTFTPPETGGYLDTIEVVSTASGSPDTFRLQSEGLERELEVTPGSVDFGAVAVGEAGGPLSVELVNTGELDVIIQPVLPPGGPFAPAGDSCGATNVLPTTLAPEATCVLEYTFNPVQVGDFQATIEIITNAPSSPDVVSLLGIGSGAVLQPDPASLEATVSLGQSEMLPLAIANAGNETLEWNVTEAPDRSSVMLRAAGDVTLPGTSGQAGFAEGFVGEPGAQSGERVSPFLPASDVDITLTHSDSLDLIAENSMACASSAGSSRAAYLRTFTLADFGIATDFEVDEVSFGIQSLSAETSITVNLYTLDGDLVYANLDLIGTATQVVGSQTLSLVTVPVEGSVPPGGTLVVEIDVPDLTPQQAAFFIGSNDLGQTAPSYVVAPGCDAHEPTDFASIGFPNIHMVMTVAGRASDCEHPGWLGIDPQSGVISAGDSQSLDVTFDTGGMDTGTYTGTLCLNSNDPVTPLTLVPLTLTVTTPPEPAPPVTRLIASDGASSDWFGRSVAIDGDTVVVSADAADIGDNTNQGAAYVFVYEGGEWTEQAKLIADDGAQFDQFGFSVSIDGDTALIGSAAGASYIFTRDDGAWTQQARLVASDGHTNDGFGLAVALDGETALIGAREHDTDGNTNQGAAYVFVRSGDQWVEQAKLIASDGVWFNLFGVSVALSGDTALIGAAFHDTGGNNNQGAAYVFTRDGDSWTEQAKLFDAAGMANDWFGNAVALDGDTAIISADQRNAFAPGKAYVYTRQGGVWDVQDVLAASDGADGDIFGEAVTVQGDIVLVGALFADEARGAAYAFTRDQGAWDELAKLWVEDALPNDQFGKSVDIDGVRAVIGAWTEDVGANASQGAVYVTELDIKTPPVDDDIFADRFEP